MAEVVLGLGASHGSSTFAPASEWGFYADRDKRKRFYQSMLDRADGSLESRITQERWDEDFEAGQRAQAALNDVVKRVAPDVIVVFGDDQREQFHHDNMPMFCVYRGPSMSRGARRRQRDIWAEGLDPPRHAKGAAEPRIFEGARHRAVGIEYLPVLAILRGNTQERRHPELEIALTTIEVDFAQS